MADSGDFALSEGTDNEAHKGKTAMYAQLELQLGSDPSVPSRDLPAHKEYDVQAILRISGLPSDVTEEQLRDVGADADRITVPLQVMISETSAELATAHLEYATQTEALHARAAFERLKNNGCHKMWQTVRDCRFDLFSITPSAVANFDFVFRSPWKSNADERFHRNTGFRCSASTASQDLEGRVPADQSFLSVASWAVSAGGQWQPALRDPRHASRLHASAKDPSPEMRYHGVSPAIRMMPSAKEASLEAGLEASSEASWEPSWEASKAATSFDSLVSDDFAF